MWGEPVTLFCTPWIIDERLDKNPIEFELAYDTAVAAPERIRGNESFAAPLVTIRESAALRRNRAIGLAPLHAARFFSCPRISFVGLSLLAAGRFFVPCVDTLAVSLLTGTPLFFFPSLRSDSWTVSSHTSSICHWKLLAHLVQFYDENRGSEVVSPRCDSWFCRAKNEISAMMFTPA
jgi:hypothetical protein